LRAVSLGNERSDPVGPVDRRPEDGADPCAPGLRDVLPGLSAEEFEALKRDVAEHGVLVPVVVDAESGAVVDGHHRVRAWEELRAVGVRVPDYPRDVRRFADEDERREFVLAANLVRRHLTRAQRAELMGRLRAAGWSLRRIGETVGASVATVHEAVRNRTPVPEQVIGRDGRSHPGGRPRTSPSLLVATRRDSERARAALLALPEDVRPQSLARAEQRAREIRYRERSEAVAAAARLAGPGYELRTGDLREVWADIASSSIDSAVVDPPYAEEHIPIFEDVGRLLARVLAPGRLAAVYCGNMHLDEELRLLLAGGLTYVWHGVNVLPGRHTRVRVRMVNGRHRSVVLLAAGAYRPRKWIHDTYVAQGRGGPETRPLHPWQQALGPVTHWVQMVSQPGEVVFDPCVGSGTTAVAALAEARRFVGGDIDPACVATARERIEAALASEAEAG
jgi:site-specific DNA-methyltransferase (adenine-specific)